jgi:hypothetical protein
MYGNDDAPESSLHENINSAVPAGAMCDFIPFFCSDMVAQAV